MKQRIRKQKATKVKQTASSKKQQLVNNLNASSPNPLVLLGQKSQLNTKFNLNS